MILPAAPHSLRLPIVTYWDGRPCIDRRLHGLVSLCAESAGLRLRASLPHQEQASLPAAPALSRVANLWEYDVVECFIVGAERYLEVELGAGGHFLALEFSAPRRRANTYESWQPQLTFEPMVAHQQAWRSTLLVPWEMVPSGVKGVNAFVSSRSHYLCHAPLPGARPDFHQPDRFPAVQLAGQPDDQRYRG